jgi:anthranilate synthase component 2
LVESLRAGGEIQLEICLPEEGTAKLRTHPCFDALIISPGPGLPEESPGLISTITEGQKKLPILGVCLGMQALLIQAGAKLQQMDLPLHGQSSRLNLLNPEDALYRGLLSPIYVGLYHSWFLPTKDCPSDYIPTAQDGQGKIMSVKHRHFPIWGVQYHPESYLCPQGDKIISNFLREVQNFASIIPYS